MQEEENNKDETKTQKTENIKTGGGKRKKSMNQ